MDERDRRASAIRDGLEVAEGRIVFYEQRAEAMEAIYAAATKDDAQNRLMELLGISELGALAILDQAVSGLTQDGRSRQVTQRNELRRLQALE